ncbi:MAG: hypothetical protein RLZZ592_2731 [Pseudomonadota bacterium]|jgi:hypothetical protein|nr:hypothetical protein [Pseudomonadota bacterium]
MRTPRRTLGLALALSLGLQSLGAGAAVAPPLDSGCAGGTLVDPAFRDAAVLMMRRLVVRAPGQVSDGAIRRTLSPAHIDASGRAWHHIAAYEANLGLIGALRIDPTLRNEAGRWLRWQIRHLPVDGQDRGVLHDRWISADGREMTVCPPDIEPRHCRQIDATDSTIASMFLLAQAYLRHGGDAALLRDPAVEQAFRRAATTLAQLQQPDGLSHAKRDHPASYLMDAVEVAAGWRALAELQQSVWRQPAVAALSRERELRTRQGIEQVLWQPAARRWRTSADAGPVDASRWYPDVMAQAWPLLWSPPEDTRTRAQAQDAWTGVATRWTDWPRRNVDPAGFWWPAAAVAAHCSGNTRAAETWLARARQAWLQPANPFPWPFQVSDLLWLLWLAEPGPPQAPLPEPIPARSP